MTVYIDDARIAATVGRTRARWSHLSADSPQELHIFAARLGLRRSWFQGHCKNPCPSIAGVCAHFHYDVVDRVRQEAITAGAKQISYRALGAICTARRPHYRGADR